MGKNSQNGSKSVADQLPQWDLSVFGFQDKASISVAMENICGPELKDLKDRDKISQFEDYELLEYIRDFESVVLSVRNLQAFASLNACTQKDNPEAVALESKVKEFVSREFVKLSFIHHELYRVPDEKKMEFLSSAKLKQYDSWLLRNLLFEPSLNEDVSAIVRQLSDLASSWPSKYDEVCSNLKFKMGNKTYSQAEIEDVAYCDPNPERRKKAQRVISQEFARNGFIFTSMLNAVLKNEDVEAKIYDFDGALELDALGNGMSKEDVLAVAAAVTDSYVAISQRYYKLLAKLLKKDRLEYTDRLINPVECGKYQKYSWQEGLDTVYEAFAEFGLDVCAKAIAGNGWIDAKPAIGKKSGAFSLHSDKPFIFMNFMGDYGSVTTLMHEMGHSIHHLLLTNKVNILNDGTTIGMSEVASEFAESLLFAKMMEKAETNKEKLYLLIDYTERQIASIHRQIAFSKFEERAYRERKKGELSEERFTQIYCEEVERYLGFPLEDDAKNSWMRIGHFFDYPLYVRYYAFSGCLVNQLRKVYASGDVEKFVERYIDLLCNTGIEDYRSLLRPFKLDPDEEDFWVDAVEVISNNIDEIERLAKEEGLL